ncbi:hypothetical protein QFC21_005020 [Naganishia friedmannii]|uniref:Uncharacterized protein n=1 Tax=Naganishia friedmannii TaxID=89922 RepID=A0ACC2VCU6_9TREE|nr:hypothetical protein QFC21_005020 [Naganishia friedmannii]
MLKLSHLLPPDAAFRTTFDRSTDDSPDRQCPRSIIGAVPPSAPLHLAIAHQLGRKTYESFGKHQQEAVDDFTVLETTVNQSHTEVTSPQSVLIIASARSKWHELLIRENSSWLQEHGGNPRIADALHRTDIKYCSNAKDALVLLTLLHMQTDDTVATIGENDASTLSGEPPSLIITWDLLNLFLEPQANEENGPDPVGNESEVQVESIGKSEVDVASARERSTVHFLDGYDMLENTTRAGF